MSNEILTVFSGWEMGMPPTTMKRQFVLVDLQNNHNKYWDITVFDNDDVLCEWGRVGYGERNGKHLSTQSRTYKGKGMLYAEKKIREKFKKGYKEIDTLEGNADASSVIASHELRQIVKEQIRSQHPQTQELIDFLTDVNAHNIYDATGGKISLDDGLLKTARGIITQSAILKARRILDQLVPFIVNDKQDDRQAISLVEDYLTIVPQNMGMKKFTVRSFLPDTHAVQKQNALLDSLDASFSAAMDSSRAAKVEDGSNITEQPSIFDVKLELVENGAEVDRVRKLYKQSRNRMHQSSRYRVRQIYLVDIAGISNVFKNTAKHLGNVWRLWHGTKASNLLSILKSGLVIPPQSSPYVTGRMYGNGIYASDQSTKALNYATTFWSGSDEGRYFMFLLDMAMGKTYTPKTKGWGMAGGEYPKAGYNSTFAKAGVSGVMNNEMIVYNVNQVNLVYLVEFER